MNTIHKLLLLQHVSFPTRARGTDTPHLLDLVITDDQFINKIDASAPLGKSDHVVLMLETNIFNSESRVELKFNYDKGDYDALRTYIECDWNTEFAAVNLEVEGMWNIIKK